MLIRMWAYVVHMWVYVGVCGVWFSYIAAAAAAVAAVVGAAAQCCCYARSSRRRRRRRRRRSRRCGSRRRRRRPPAARDARPDRRRGPPFHGNGGRTQFPGNQWFRLNQHVVQAKYIGSSNVAWFSRDIEKSYNRSIDLGYKITRFRSKEIGWFRAPILVHGSTALVRAL